MKRLRMGLLVLIAAAGLSLPAAAQASSGTGSSTAGKAAISGTGSASPQACSPGSSVPITEYGYTGHTICGFDYSWISYTNGQVEYFVVGTDYAVWHIWKGGGNWKTLGGRARHALPNGAYTYLDPEGVETIGTDNNWWCRDRNGGTWSGGWFRC